MTKNSFMVLSVLSLYTIGMLAFYLINKKTASMEVAFSEKFTEGVEEKLGL